MTSIGTPAAELPLAVYKAAVLAAAVPCKLIVLNAEPVLARKCRVPAVTVTVLFNMYVQLVVENPTGAMACASIPAMAAALVLVTEFPFTIALRLELDPSVATWIPEISMRLTVFASNCTFEVEPPAAIALRLEKVEIGLLPPCMIEFLTVASILDVVPE